MGNSLTAGIGAGLAPGFVSRYRYLAEKVLRQDIISHVYARPGATTDRLLRMMNHPPIRQTLKTASIVTVSAGGNDLLRAGRIFFRTKDLEVVEQALKRFQVNMSQIVKHLLDIKAENKQAYIIRLIDVYNPYPEEMIAEDTIGKFNQHLGGLARGNVAVTNVHATFKGKERELLTFDRIHPNAKGYQVIADQLHALGYGPLV